jgi:hypothetical protein
MTEWHPKPKMVKLVDLLVDWNDDRPVYKKCEEAGVSPSTFYCRWLRNEYFASYYKDRRTRALRAHGTAVDRALVARATKGEIPAMRLFYERLGELKEAEEERPTVINVISSIPRSKDKDDTPALPSSESSLPRPQEHRNDPKESA